MANKLNLSDIAQYLKSRTELITIDNGIIKIGGTITLGMSKSEIENIVKIYKGNETHVYPSISDFTFVYDEKEKLIAIYFKLGSECEVDYFYQRGISKNLLVSEPYTGYILDESVLISSPRAELLTYSNHGFTLTILMGYRCNHLFFKEWRGHKTVKIVGITAPNVRDENNNPYNGKGIFACEEDKEGRVCFRIFDNKELKDNDDNRKYYQFLINNGAKVK